MTGAILIGWVALCAVMFAHRRLRAERVAERAPGTWLGIVVQAAGFSLVWTMRRGTELPGGAALALTGVADACGAAAVALGLAAIWTLGRQWSVDGRVLPDHALIARGPYAYVRHPVYTAMFGMLLATALSMSSLPGLASGIAVFVAGTLARVHFEEKLLRKRFGPSFDAYAAAVPAFFPRLGRRSCPGSA
jgi:protein-S-isoprenylcysteine O-methyltransferase Ste14